MVENVEAVEEAEAAKAVEPEQAAELGTTVEPPAETAEAEEIPCIREENVVASNGETAEESKKAE